MRILLILLIILFPHFLSSQELQHCWIKSGITETPQRLILSPNEKIVAIEQSNSILFYDIQKQQIINVYETRNSFKMLDFSEDSKHLLAFSGEKLLRLSIENEKSQESNENVIPSWFTPYATAIGFSYSADTVAFTNLNCEGILNSQSNILRCDWNIQLYDFKNDKYSILDSSSFYSDTPNHPQVYQNSTIAISQLGDKIATTNDSGYINIYNFIRIDSISLIKQFRYTLEDGTDWTLRCKSLLFNEAGDRLILSQVSGVISIWNVNSGKLDFMFQKNNPYTSLFGRKIVNNKLKMKAEHKYYTYDLQKNELIDSLTIDKNKYVNYFLSNDFSKIIYYSDGKIIYKNLSDSDSLVFDILTNPIFMGAANDKYLLTKSSKSIIDILDKTNGSLLNRIDLGNNEIRTFKVSPDNSKLFILINNFYQIWDLNSSTMLLEKAISEYNNNQITFTFSADSKSFWVNTEKFYVSNFEVNSGKIIQKFFIDRFKTSYIGSIEVNESDTKIAIGYYYTKGSSTSFAYEFIDLVNNNSQFIESIPGVYDNSFFSKFINDTTFLTYNTDYRNFKPIIKLSLWDVKDLTIISEFQFDYTEKESDEYDNFIFLNQSQFVAIYSKDGNISFYKNMDFTKPVFVFNTYLILEYVHIDEENGKMYAISSNGTLKCYEVSGLLSFLDVPDFEENNTNLIIFPNPVENYLFISESYKVKKIEIYNQFGQKMLESINETKINIESLVKGVYFIKIGDQFHKFIKL